MSKKEKLIERIQGLPKDFTFSELETLLIYFGFEKSNKGKTSGSRVKLKEKQYLAHKPHPTSIIKEKALKDIVDFLKENEFIKNESNKNTEA